MRLASLALASVAALTVSCKDKDSDDVDTLSGDIDVPFSQVGNQVSLGQLQIGTTGYDLHATMAVSKNQSGVATYTVAADVPANAKLQSLLDGLPIDVTGTDGRFGMDLNVKVTSEGMQDQFTTDGGKPQILVKYDANVGDSWTAKKMNGEMVTRSVTQKSTTDDFAYGFMLIKVMTVEQNSSIPGVSKIIMKFNHKFGLVFVEFLLEDGTRVNGYLYTQNS
jgi:hypothetical protein